MLTRRSLLGSLGCAALLVGCGAPPGAAPAPGASGGPMTGDLRVSWFGSEARNKAIQGAVDAFVAAHPGVSVKTESVGFANYFDKLATQFAANDAPDVVMLNEQQLGAYVKRKALGVLDAVKTDGFDKAAAGAGVIKGERYGAAGGINTMTLLANPKLIEGLGLTMPDDATWTWQQYSDFAAQVTEKSGGKSFGSSLPNSGPALELWLRQNGKALFTADGTLGFEPADAAAYFTFLKSMADRKALPAATLVVEEQKSLEVSGSAIGRSALGWFWNSASGAIDKVLGHQTVMLRPPSKAGASQQAGLYVKPDSLWCLNSRGQSKPLAQQLINYLVNDPAAAKAIGVATGIPSNTAAREAIAPTVKGADKNGFDYYQKIKGDLAERVAPPAGAGKVDELGFRNSTDVLFGRATPEQAGQQFHADLGSAIA